ncbi:MAG TPA: PAS domain-containing protein [Chthoniobacteraceae bacterium]|nr:PAS domain-containing protein [Chthoniobacteraceae bacterium]
MTPLETPTPVSSFRKVQQWIEEDQRLSQNCTRHARRGIAVLAAITILLAAAGWWLFRSNDTQKRAVSALRLARAAEVELAEAEASHRGFVTSRTPHDLQQLTAHRIELQHQLESLSAFFDSDPDAAEIARGLIQQSQLLRDATQTPGLSLRDSQADGAGPPASAFPSRSIIEGMDTTMRKLVQRCEERVDQLDAGRQLQQALFGGGVLLSSVVAIGFLFAARGRGSHPIADCPMQEVEVEMEQAKATVEVAKATEQVAQITTAQTDAILAAARDGVIVFDQKTRIRWINFSAEKMFRLQPGKVLGQNLALLIPQISSVRDGGALPRTAAAVGQREGYYPFPVEISLSEVTRDGEKHFCALIRDNSEHHRHENALTCMTVGLAPSAPEDFTRLLLKNLSKALRTERAFFLEISGEGHNAVAMLTMSEGGELAGTTAIDLQKTACAEVLCRGFRLVAEGVREQFPDDSMFAKTASQSFAGAPLTDYRGRAGGVVGVFGDKPFEDIAMTERVLKIFATRAAAEIERKRSEEALAIEKEQLAVTLRSIGDGCMTLDNEGRIVMLNLVAEQLTGWSQKDAVGQLVHEVLHLVDDQTRRRCQRLIERVIQNTSGEPSAEMKTIVARTGEERRVESSSAPIRDRRGRKLGAIIVLRDVTDRLRMEEERQKTEKLESLGLVAGGIAHDFNNLLTMILGNVTLALGVSNVSPVVAERLTAARKSTNRARDLASQLLTFAKGGNPVMQFLDLAPLVTDTVQCAAGSAPVECEIRLPEGLWPVEADPGQIATVIANIAANAVEAMPAGGNLDVTAENLELPVASISTGLSAGRWVRMAVHDQGIGVPEQFLQKIFDPYFTTKPTNSGLGLATAYSIVKNHGGIIHVESPPGEGSTFSVYLPASDKELMPAAAADAPVPTGSGRVLVLDDEEAICMLVTCALEPLGYEVTETQDGTVALAKYEESMKDGRKYDLVISDLTMPGRMSGHEAIRRLRELDPEVRAIVSSGYANDPVMSRFEEFGFCGMIAKPYEIDALGRKVAEIMAQPREPQVIYHTFDERKTA